MSARTVTIEDARRLRAERQRGRRIVLRFALAVADRAFVTGGRVEHREERLIGIRSVAPVGFPARLVPDAERRAELIVGLGVIRRVVPSSTKILGECLHMVRWDGQIGSGEILGSILPGAHVHRPDRVLVHPRDDRCATRRAYW